MEDLSDKSANLPSPKQTIIKVVDLDSSITAPHDWAAESNREEPQESRLITHLHRDRKSNKEI